MTGAAPARRLDASEVEIGVTCELIMDELGIGRLRQCWDDLRERCLFPSPYTDWRYLDTWLDCFAPDAQRVFCVVREGTRVVSILPLFIERPDPFSVGLRRLRQIGFEGRFARVDMTEEPIWLVQPGSESNALLATARALLFLREWDVIIFRGQGDRFGEAFERAAKKLRVMSLPIKVKAGSLVADLPDTWAEYRKQLSKSMRDNLSYYPRLLTRRGHEWQIEAAYQGPELEKAIDELVRLHWKRFESAEGKRANHLPTGTQHEFLRRLHRTLGRDRSGFVSTLRVDGRVVAAQSAYESGSTLLVNYSGFDPEWSSFSPLFVLQADIFKSAIERGIRRLDFLRGDKAWQTRWAAKASGELAQWIILRPNPWPMVRAGMYATRCAFLSILPR